MDETIFTDLRLLCNIQQFFGISLKKVRKWNTLMMKKLKEEINYEEHHTFELELLKDSNYSE